MKMDDIIEKILTLSRKKHSSDENLKLFQDYVEGLSYEQLEDLLTAKIHNFDVPQLLNSIFLGLSSKNASQKKRIKIFEHVLKLLETEEIHSSTANGLVTWLVVELEKMSATHVVRVCDLCVAYVSKSESPQHTNWKSIIPKALSLLMEKKEVDHYGTEMTGEKYKSEVVTALSQAKWHKNILSSVADMFRFIPMSNEEHSRILGKLVSSLEDVGGPELPPLGHNLLLLGKTQGLVMVLFALNSYFQKHLYTRPPTQSDIDIDRKEVADSECVMLYHVSEIVREDSGAGAQILKAARLSQAAPHLWLQPFLLATLLALSDIPPHGDQVVSVVGGMVERLSREEEMLREYAWLRKLQIQTTSTEEVFTRLIKSEVCGQEGVLHGLVSLGMYLLGKERKVARIGRLIAVNLISKHPYVAGHLINTIADAIISHPNLTHFTDCLCEVCDTAPLVVVEHSGALGHLMEELPSLPIAAAYRLASAIVALFKVSHKVRDSLVLALRKALFAHNVNARKVAVIGFLQLLKRMKMRGGASLSQNSFQIYTCPSIFTQSCLQVHSQSSSSASANNEGLCLEILNVLKRCFVQLAEIKMCLYEGMSRALLENPELCLPASEMFLARLRLFYQTDTSVLPPLRFADAITVSDGNLVVQEPLGELVFVVQQTVVTTGQILADAIDNEEYSLSRDKIFAIMDSLVERFALCTPKILELEDEEEDESGVERKRKEEVLRQGLGVVEALIAYFLWKWNLTVTVENSKSLLALYRTHSGLLDFAKEFKVHKNDKDTKKTQTTQKKPGAPKKSTWVLPPTILDFETVHRLLTLLLSENVEWCGDDVIEDLQGRRPLHRYAMGSCASVLAKTRSRLAHYKPRSTFNNLLNLAKLLFEKVLKDIPKLMEFDPTVAVLGVENFTEVFSLISEFFPAQLSKFLFQACGVEEKEGLNAQLERVIKSYLKSLGKILDMDDEEEDLNHKKLMSALIAGVNAVCLQLPVTEACIVKVVGWLHEVVEKRVLSSVPDAKALLSLLITLSHRTKPDSSLYDNLALHLATIFSTINDVELEKADTEYAMVTEDTKGIVIPLLAGSLNSRLSSIDWLLQRIKAEFSLLSPTQSPSSFKGALKEKEREVIVQAGFVSSTAQILATIKAPASGELLSKTLHHLYSSLTNLTKYFHLRSSVTNPAYQEARFGKLVKLAGSHLSSQLAEFLLFIESLERVVEDNKNKISIKVLREAKRQTGYIPKLVSELENFTKCVTQLSNKCKDPSLVSNMKLTTTRDFRLNTRKLEELIKEQQEVGEEEEPEEEEPKKKQRGPGRKRKTEDTSSQSQASEPSAKKPPRKRTKQT